MPDDKPMPMQGIPKMAVGAKISLEYNGELRVFVLTEIDSRLDEFEAISETELRFRLRLPADT